MNKSRQDYKGINSYVMSISIDSNITFIMRKSQYRKYRDQLEEDQSYSNIHETALNLNRNQNKKNQYSSRDANYPKQIKPKYQPKGKNQYLNLLKEPSQKEKPSREDYNIRNSPSQPQSSRQNDGYLSKKSRDFRSKEELDEQIQQYRRRGEKREQKQVSRAGRTIKQPINLDDEDDNMVLKDVELSNFEDKDLSFTQLKTGHNFKKEKKVCQESLDYKEEPEKEEKMDQSSDWLEPDKQPQKKKEEKRQLREEEKPLKREKSEKQEKKREQVKKEEISASQCGTITMNKGFNQFSKDSSNQSSCWLQEKILQSLQQSNFIDSDSHSNANSESFISNIPDNSRLLLQQSLAQQSLVPSEQEQAKIDNILKQIQNSSNFEERDIVLQMKSIKNIQQIIIKQVFINKLGMSLTLSLNEDTIIVKRSLIQVEQLIRYISFYQIRVINPRIFQNQPQSTEFSLCRIRVPLLIERQGSEGQTGFIKKGKRKEQESENGSNAAELLRVVRVEVKCMNCQKFNDVPVIEKTNQASLSCRNCNEQMIAKIQRIAFSA